MSLHYTNSSEVLGGPITSSLINQLEKRKSIIGKRTSRTTEELQFLNSQNIWVKMTSAVDVFDKNDKRYSDTSAKSNILVGGTLLNGKLSGGILTDDNPAYLVDENLGYRPKAGITNFSVQPKNLYGTLRTATVEFYVASRDQFDEIEQLFLRPGFSVLLEWGHSYYVNNEGEFSSGEKVYDDFFTPNKGVLKVTNELNKLKQDTDFNYDGLHGIIKNFSWSFNQNGGYDCTVELITYGELLESLQVAVPKPSIASKELNTKEAAKVEVLNVLNDVSSDLEFKLTLDKIGDLQSPVFPFAEVKNKAYILEFRTQGIVGPRGLGQPELGTHRYITLGKFLEYINDSLMLKKSEKVNIIKWNTQLDKSNFVTFTEHISSDPFLVLFPKEKLGNINPLSTLNSSFPSRADILTNSSLLGGDYSIIRPPKNGGQVYNTLNIWLNVNFLIQCVKECVSNTDPKSTSIKDLIDKVIATMNKCSGGVNSFDTTFDFSTNQWYVIDRKTVPDRRNLPKLNLFGVGSMVENLSFTSKLTNSISTMLAISAQANQVSSVENVLNLHKWNNGLKDRQNPIRKQQAYTDKDDLKGLEEAKSPPLDEFNKVIKAFNSSKGKDNRFKVDNEEFSEFKFEPIHRSVMQMFLKNKFKNLSQKPGLVPFELTFSMRGASGLKIGQAFTIDDTVLLPNRYRGNIGFIITGVTHRSASNRWVTDVKTQMIVL